MKEKCLQRAPEQSCPALSTEETQMPVRLVTQGLRQTHGDPGDGDTNDLLQ